MGCSASALEIKPTPVSDRNLLGLLFRADRREMILGLSSGPLGRPDEHHSRSRLSVQEMIYPAHGC